MKFFSRNRLLFKAICVSFTICMIFSMIPFESECQSISEDVFRLHILANSDSNEDQALKLCVRNAVLDYANNLYKNSKSKQESIKLTKENLSSIIAIAQKTVREKGYDYKVTAKITNMYFNTRYYENITMPSGMYDALQIKIGSGEGHNWWCVMYPSLCLSSGVKSEELDKALTDEQKNIVDGEKNYVVKFKVVEYYEKLISFFKGEK